MFRKTFCLEAHSWLIPMIAVLVSPRPTDGALFDSARGVLQSGTDFLKRNRKVALPVAGK